MTTLNTTPSIESINLKFTLSSNTVSKLFKLKTKGETNYLIIQKDKLGKLSYYLKSILKVPTSAVIQTKIIADDNDYFEDNEHTEAFITHYALLFNSRIEEYLKQLKEDTIDFEITNNHLLIQANKKNGKFPLETKNLSTFPKLIDENVKSSKSVFKGVFSTHMLRKLSKELNSEKVMFNFVDYNGAKVLLLCDHSYKILQKVADEKIFSINGNRAFLHENKTDILNFTSDKPVPQFNPKILSKINETKNDQTIFQIIDNILILETDNQTINASISANYSKIDHIQKIDKLINLQIILPAKVVNQLSGLAQIIPNPKKETIKLHYKNNLLTTTGTCKEYFTFISTDKTVAKSTEENMDDFEISYTLPLSDFKNLPNENCILNYAEFEKRPYLFIQSKENMSTKTLLNLVTEKDNSNTVVENSIPKINTSKENQVEKVFAQ